MESKINIAELLKDCPKGMELDCTMYENVTLAGVDMSKKQFPIEITIGGFHSRYLTKEGCFHDNTIIPEAKCVIFPKGKTTWEGFQRPFKDGDIIFVKSKESGVELISIYKNESSHLFYDYCSVSLDNGTFYFIGTTGFIPKNDISINRFATEEEKQKLFDAIKENGYKWNEITKTLEKLIRPKFKVGDRIKYRSGEIVYRIVHITEDTYVLDNLCSIPISIEHMYNLVPNKFDITTLKPFDKVLVRDNSEQKWNVDMFSFYDKNLIYPFVCVGHYVSQCIPYEQNKHLLGTTNDCDDFYKT